MKRVFAAAIGIPLSLASSSAVAAPMFVDSIGQPGDDLLFSGPDLLEARFRADTTNWDLRLENSGSPSPMDNQANLANGRGAFEGRGFKFILSYSEVLEQVEWMVQRGHGVSSSLLFETNDFSAFNAIQFATSGSRATLDVDDLVFSALGIVEGAWPDLSASPGGPSFSQTNLFFGDGADLLAGGDWTLSGTVVMNDFTHNNPSEGAKVNIRLVQAAQIPSPSGLAGLALAAGFCVIRRRC